MSDFIISCCSTADLSKKHLDNRNVSYVYFHYTVDGKAFDDDLGQTMSMTEFYKKMDEGAMTSTAQVNIGEYTEYFEKLLETGKDVLHISLSSGLSGSYNSACNAAKPLREKYPNQKLYVVDSLGASSGMGLMVETLADMRDEGKSIDEIYSWIEENKLKLHHWFFSTDLKFYVRGGRVSKVAGLFGGILGICPLLNMDNNGKLIPRHKIRGKAKVIDEIVTKMKEHAEGGKGYTGKCFISQSACMEDAMTVAGKIEDYFEDLNGNVIVNDIGPTIGSHTGPGTIALFFWGDERVD